MECFLGYNWLAPTSPKRLRHILRHGIGPIRTAFSNGAGFARSRYWGPPGAGGAQADSSAELLLLAFHSRFEVAEEVSNIRNRILARRECKANLSSIKSLDLLGYNLRALLHRNDAMGMAASIEARFPFLDTGVVRAAVSMPSKYKLRFAPTSFHHEHPLFADKSILRKIADRYLPTTISRRPKQAFAGRAYAASRLIVDRNLLRGSFVGSSLRFLRTKLISYMKSQPTTSNSDFFSLRCGWAYSYTAPRKSSWPPGFATAFSCASAVAHTGGEDDLSLGGGTVGFSMGAISRGLGLASCH